MTAALAKLQPLLVDAVGLAGLTLVGVGAWQIYPPAALITIGVLLMIWAALAARRAAP